MTRKLTAGGIDSAEMLCAIENIEYNCLSETRKRELKKLSDSLR